MNEYMERWTKGGIDDGIGVGGGGGRGLIS